MAKINFYSQIRSSRVNFINLTGFYILLISLSNQVIGQSGLGYPKRLVIGVNQFETTGFELGLSQNMITGDGSKSFHDVNFDPKSSYSFCTTIGVYPFLTKPAYTFNLSAAIIPALKIPFFIEASFPLYTSFSETGLYFRPKMGFFFFGKKAKDRLGSLVNEFGKDKAFAGLKLSYAYNISLVGDIFPITHQISLSIQNLGNKVIFKPTKIYK